MILNDSSEIIHFDNTPISKAEQLGLGFPKKMRYYINNVVRINGKYYYAKKCSTSTLINELLGSYFSTTIDLDSVDYLIGKSDTDSRWLYALSEIFYKDDYSYTTVEDIFADMRPDDSKAFSRGLGSLYVCDTSVLSLVSSSQIITGALKMTAVDLKMGQVDRYNYTLDTPLAVDLGNRVAELKRDTKILQALHDITVALVSSSLASFTSLSSLWMGWCRWLLGWWS